MPFDTTNVAATVGQNVQPFDPFAMAGKFAAVQNALNQNKLFQAQQAGGQAYAASLNPDGTVNRNALAAAFRDPRLGLVAPEMLQAGQTLSTAQQGQAATQKSAALNVLGSVLPDMSITDPAARDLDQKKRAAVALGRAEAAGVIPKGMGAQTIGEGFPGLTTADAAQQAALQTQNGAEVAQQVGIPTTVGTGGGNLLINQRPAEGTASVVASIPNTPAPTTAAVQTGTGTQFVGVDPTKGTTTPIGAAVKSELPVGTQIWVANPSEPGGGHFALTSPNGPVQNQPPLGAVAASNAAASAIGAGSGTAFVGLQQKADAARANLTTAQELDQIINNPNYAPGPRAATIQAMGSLAQQLGIPLPKDWQEGTALIETAHKLQSVMISQSLSSFNEGVSDARQALSTSTNVQNEISRLGQQSIMPTIQGISDAAIAKQALGNEWLKTHPTGEGYSNFATQYNAKVDPMIFAAKHMPPEMHDALIKGMTSDQRKEFNTSREWAIAHGLLAP